MTKNKKTDPTPILEVLLPDSGFRGEFFFRPFQGRLDMFVEWTPKTPNFRRLSSRDLNTYRVASTQAMLLHPAAQGPGNVVRVEL
jgi:hypothetical protein